MIAAHNNRELWNACSPLGIDACVIILNLKQKVKTHQRPAATIVAMASYEEAIKLEAKVYQTSQPDDEHIEEMMQANNGSKL